MGVSGKCVWSVRGVPTYITQSTSHLKQKKLKDANREVYIT